MSTPDDIPSLPRIPESVRESHPARVAPAPEMEDWMRAAFIEPPWWRKTWTWIRLLVAFGGGLVFGYVATKLIPDV